MLKKLIVAATFIAPIYASEGVLRAPTKTTVAETQQPLSETIALIIQDLEKIISYMQIVKTSSYNIDKVASAQRTVLMVLTKMGKLADTDVSIQEIARFNEVYKAFKQALRETYESQTAEADMHEDAVEAETDVETVIA